MSDVGGCGSAHHGAHHGAFTAWTSEAVEGSARWSRCVFVRTFARARLIRSSKRVRNINNLNQDYPAGDKLVTHHAMCSTTPPASGVGREVSGVRRGLPYLTGRSERLFSSNSPRPNPRPALHRCGLCILRRPSAHTSTASGVREVACDRWAANAHVTYRVSPDLPDERSTLAL